MPVEWQGDHKLLGDEKERFGRELKRLGLEPSNFLVEVRQEPDVEGRADAMRYATPCISVTRRILITRRASSPEDKGRIG
jgi:hypothetical protein